MTVGLGLLAVVLLVLLNGFFVATEFALVKVRPTQLDELARRGSHLARQARRLTRRLDEYLSGTQLGITVASLGLGWIGEPVFARILDPLVQRFGLSEATVETIGATLAFLAITFLHIVFGELAPKSVAIQRAEATSLAVALPMRVVDGDIDHIVGILHERDLYFAPSDPKTPAELRAILREPVYVPEFATAEDLLREFRRRRQPMSIVVDEYGGTAGLVTREDVVEAILGELRDEYDAGGPAIQTMPDGRFAVDPQIPLEEFTRFFEMPLPEEDVATLAGLLMARLGRLAAQGDRLSLGPIELTVEQVEGPRIVRLTARRVASEARPD